LFPYVQNKRIYGSAFCFRILSVLDEDKNDYVKILRSLFEEKEVIFVGGGEPFPGLVKVRAFIQTPLVNAFDEYHGLLAEIQAQVMSFSKPCVLLSCGITATALSAELNAMGITAYDVGLCLTKRLAPFI
ncbi:MAG: DUF1792 domain-containing protein, partial [Deltaproteobacteria bacterium]|nr:DUF1792 domain-containing protein [Deltaproteobacteria bacterium]